MQPRISLITLGVSDLQRSLRFYRDGLRLAEYEAYDNVVFFKLRGTWLALFGRDDLAADAGIASEGSGFARFSLAHNVESKDAVLEVMREAEAAGATIVKPAQAAEWGGFSGYFSDPDGFLWEVAWNPHFDLT